MRRFAETADERDDRIYGQLDDLWLHGYGWPGKEGSEEELARQHAEQRPETEPGKGRGDAGA